MSSLWIFGYGSLIWKVDFPYVRKLCGYITGFDRKFYQLSIDHRGTEDKPGRVVTLIPVESSRKLTSKVFGVAYEIDPEEQAKVLNHLDFREKNGYNRVNVKFYPTTDSNQTVDPLDLIVYVATEDNCSYAGHTDIPELAAQVISATGPSGRNRDYVYNLAKAFRELFPGEHDEHLFALEEEVKRQEANEQEQK